MPAKGFKMIWFYYALTIQSLIAFNRKVGELCLDALRTTLCRVGFIKYAFI